jgi:hypothetical protein
MWRGTCGATIILILLVPDEVVVLLLTNMASLLRLPTRLAVPLRHVPSTELVYLRRTRLCTTDSAARWISTRYAIILRLLVPDEVVISVLLLANVAGLLRLPTLLAVPLSHAPNSVLCICPRSRGHAFIRAARRVSAIGTIPRAVVERAGRWRMYAPGLFPLASRANTSWKLALFAHELPSGTHAAGVVQK